MRLTRSHWLIVCLLLFALDAAAQQSWNNVKTLAPGTRVRVAGPRPSPIEGRLESANDDSLVLTSAASQETFTRLQITRVSVKKPGHRVRNTLIGFGVGAGTGLGIGAGIDAGCHSDCIAGHNLGKVIFTPIGAIGGALVGLVIPTGGWHQIYKQ